MPADGSEMELVQADTCWSGAIGVALLIEADVTAYLTQADAEAQITPLKLAAFAKRLLCMLDFLIV